MNNIIKKFKLKRKTANARKWKHKKGGAFVKGVNVLDSNPDAYKYVKKKYKMRSALQGGNTANWVSAAASIGSNLLSVAKENLKITADINSKIALNEIDFNKALEQVVELNMENTSEKYLKWIKDYQSGLTFDNPSLIVTLHQGWEELNLKITKLKNDLKNKNGLLLAEADALKLENTTNALVNGALNIMSMLASKWGSGYTPKFNTSSNSFTNTSGYSAATVTLPVSSPTFNYKPVV